MRTLTVPLTVAALVVVGCEPSRPSNEPAEERRASASAESGRVTTTSPSALLFESNPSEATPVHTLSRGSRAQAQLAADAGSTGAGDESGPRPARAQASGASGCRLSLNRLEIAADVEAREPVPFDGPVRADGERVVAFTDFSNTGAPGNARIEWTHPASGYRFAYSVEVGEHPRYRTWTRHRIAPHRAGRWVIEVSDAEGCVVGETSFDALAEDARHDH